MRSIYTLALLMLALRAPLCTLAQTPVLTCYPSHERDMRLTGTGLFHTGLIKVHVPGANFRLRDTVFVRFGEPIADVRQCISQFSSWGAGGARPYLTADTNLHDGISCERSVGYVISPDTVGYSMHYGGFIFQGPSDVEVFYRGRKWRQDQAFFMDGVKPPVSYYHVKRADSISLHNMRGYAGQSLDVEITGRGTTFQQGSSTVVYMGLTYDELFPNQLIVDFENDPRLFTCNSVRVLSPTRMIANITIPAGTPPGLYDYTLFTTTDGTKWINNGFEVLAGQVAEPGHLQGSIYLDENANCRRDSAESGAASVVVRALPGNYLALTDNNGLFDVQVPMGTYTLRYEPGVGRLAVCDTPASYAVTNTMPILANLRAAIKAGPNDVIVSGASGRARPGFAYTLSLQLSRNGSISTIPGGRLRVVLDTALDYTGASPAPTRVSGDTLEYLIAQLGSLRQFNIFSLLPPNIALLGDTLVSKASYTSAYPDTNLTNNSTTISTVVTGSYDPNDKAVEPVHYLPSDSVLTYLIRFQNTGTDTAFTVVVRDTLAAELDPSTVRALIASHPYTMQLKGQNKLAWRFDNILLADSNTNERKSHGFVRFSVKRRRGLASVDTVSNVAHIYFDFNPAVVTNTAKTSRFIPVAIARPAQKLHGALVLPNPVKGQARLQLTGGSRAQGKATLRVFDMQGRCLSTTLNLSGTELPFAAPAVPGLYTIRLTEGGKSLVTGRFAVE